MLWANLVVTSKLDMFPYYADSRSGYLGCTFHYPDSRIGYLGCISHYPISRIGYLGCIVLITARYWYIGGNLGKMPLDGPISFI